MQTKQKGFKTRKPFCLSIISWLRLEYVNQTFELGNTESDFEDMWTLLAEDDAHGYPEVKGGHD